MDELLEDFNEEFSIEDLIQPVEDSVDEEYEQEEEYTEEESDEELQEEDDESDEQEDEESENEEVEAEDDGDVSYSPFIESLIEDGVLDWDGETEYEDSPEGFKQMIDDNVNGKVNQYLSSLPEDVQRLIEIGLSGGDVREAFTRFEEVDYSSADIEDESVATNMIKEYYSSTNPKWNETRIAKQIEMLQDAGEFEEEAKLAQEYLVEKKEEERAAYIQETKAQREAEEASYYEELNAYSSLIDEKEGFFGLNFASKQEKEAFKSYVFERGDDGKTQAERDDEDRTTRLAKEFYKFRKFGYEDVEKKARTSNAIKLKKSLSRFADKNSSTSRIQTSKKDDSSKFSLGEVYDF
jgi:hypothetical protein